MKSVHSGRGRPPRAVQTLTSETNIATKSGNSTNNIKPVNGSNKRGNKNITKTSTNTKNPNTNIKRAMKLAILKRKRKEEKSKEEEISNEIKEPPIKKNKRRK